MFLPCTVTEDASMCSWSRIVQHGVALPGCPLWKGLTLLAILAVGLAVVAAGERPGNGCPPPAPGTTPATAAASQRRLAYMVLPDQIDGHAYYRLDGTVTCKANNAEHTVIKSWANKVSFHGDQLLVWGPVCNDTPTVIALREAAAELMITRDLKTIFYKGECLAYSEHPPKLCAQGIWCPVKPEE
jgi:hypothetical protein